MNTRRAAALSFLNEVQVKTEAQDAAEAGAFIVCVYDPQIDARSYSGPFADPVEAMACADLLLEQVNRGLSGDQPWTATVEILTQPDLPTEEGHHEHC